MYNTKTKAATSDPIWQVHMSRLARLMSRSLKRSPLLPLPSTSRFDRFDKPRHGCCSVGHRGHQALASHAPNSNVTIARRIQQNMSSVFSTCKYIRSLANLAKRDPFVPLRSSSFLFNVFKLSFWSNASNASGLRNAIRAPRAQHLWHIIGIHASALHHCVSHSTQLRVRLRLDRPKITEGGTRWDQVGRILRCFLRFYHLLSLSPTILQQFSNFDLLWSDTRLSTLSHWRWFSTSPSPSQ